MRLPVLTDARRWLVVDKPAGIAVHPGPRTRDSVEQLLAAATPRPPLPVHRLDHDTSGCLLLARDRAALRRLSALFSERAATKIYWAIVSGFAGDGGGVIDQPLAKISSREKGWRMVPERGGLTARTAWRVLARHGSLCAIEFRPETGRTHQIRVHATLLAPGAAIVGDPVYGRSDARGMMLHARALTFVDPWTGQTQTAEAPCPGRFIKLGFDLE
jgi:tRNA pseudouridine32 synthase/23S rRNA pseudouridine746 synthase